MIKSNIFGETEAEATKVTDTQIEIYTLGTKTPTDREAT